MMSTQPKKVMIVEDDILLLLVEERLVRRLGYEIAGTASEGDLAISKVKKLNPDILLVDIHIRGSMTGLQIVEQLHAEDIDIPVIFLSGTDDRSIIERAKALGCAHFLRKPVTAEELNVALKDATRQLTNSGQHAA
jgi:YesN/AraC family two-component response regulator